ncbi:MAG: response regulator [Pseudomonadales bacterium]|nr:response regulator [Pseudomonadales bacterium]
MALIQGLEFYVDEAGSASIQTMIDPNQALNWQSTGDKSPNFGFDDRVYWYRLSLLLEKGSQTSYLMQVDKPILDSLSVFYAVNNELIATYHTGDMKPFPERPIINRNFIFPLELSSEHPVDIYLKVETDSPQMMPLTLWNPDVFEQKDRILSMAHSFYYGIVFVMIIYNLSVFFSVKDFNYLFYVMSIAAFAMFDASMNGYTFQYIWPEAVFWNDKAPMFFLNLFIFFRALFVFAFLNLRELGSWIVRFHLVFLALTVVSFLSVFLAPIAIAITIGLTLGFVGLIAGLVDGALSWSHGKKHARFFVVGWTVFMGALLIHLFTNIGLVTINTITLLATQIGSACEIILFTFALALRVRLVHDERDELKKLATKALQDSNLALKESLRVKNEFLATISHELRTPMNGVIASFENILHTNNPKEMHQICSTGNQSAHEMMGMVDRILGYAELQSGNIEVQKVEFSLRKLCTDLNNDFKLRASSQGLQLSYEIPDSLPDRLMGDPHRLYMVLSNLLDNAVKFTYEGGIQLAVSEWKLDDNSTNESISERIALRFSVKDSGIGVPAESQSYIFEKFHQADGSYHRRHGGLGLGLSISQALASAMGGDLTYQSAEGGGSLFVLSLTCEFLPDRRDTASFRPHVINLESKQVLIVEDNKVNQMVLKSMLQKLGATTILAENGEEALQQVQAQKIDLILMDLQMPVMDGFEATKHIRQMDHKISKVPIIAVTANVMDVDRKRSKECGMDDFVSKPVNREKMHQVFEKWLGHQDRTE